MSVVRAAVASNVIRRTTAAPMPIVIVGHVDHGKSTLIGRLLHDTGSLDEAQVAVLEAASARRGEQMEWSFLLDALQAERDQGITIDTTRIWFRTATRPYVIIDAPGHAEFLRNMVTGAASAAAAVLILDAEQGLGEQTRRHSVLLSILGVRQIVVAINKMDLVEWSETRFRALEAELADWLSTLGLEARLMLPLAARHGDNLARPSPQLGWWDGPTLVEALDGLEAPPRPIERPLRLAVQDVYRRADGPLAGRWAAGRIDAGRVAVGQRLRILPTGQPATVAALDVAGRGLPEASSGAAVAIRFVEDVLLARGQLIVPEDAPDAGAPVLAGQMRLRAFWLDRDALMAGERLLLRVHAQEVACLVERIEHPIDLATLTPSDGALIDGELGAGGFADVTLRLARPLPCDPATPDAPSGRGVLLRHGRIAGGGLIREAMASRARDGAAQLNDGIEAGAGRRGQVYWLYGLSGAGKSTVAAAMRARLAAEGRPVVVLDGDALRLGLNRDLGFSSTDRHENIRRAAEMAALLAAQGVDVIAALITPEEAMRNAARAILGPAARLIWVKAGLETCAARDPKGLYAKAKDGELKDFTGISAGFEVPVEGCETLDTEALSADAAAAQALSGDSRYAGLSEGL